MLRIDGSQGEGGGQILRSAVSLSAITGKAIEITNIRSKRPNPGLRPSHLTAIKALVDLFDARAENLKVGAQWVRFEPSGRFEGGKVRLDIGTAGSIPLTLMAVVPAVSLSRNEVELEIAGGTDVKGSPTMDYVRYVVADIFRSIGIKFSVEIEKRGYYPKGGGVVKTAIMSCKSPAASEFLNSRYIEPRITSVCSNLPKHVAERQIASALISLEKHGIKCNNYTASYETALSPGSSILIYCVSDFGGPYIGGDSIGEIGKRAETVGQEAAGRFTESVLAGAAVDPFIADMLVLPLCLSKGVSIFKTARVTGHLRTNLEVAKAVTGCKFGIEPSDKGYLVRIETAGPTPSPLPTTN